jgi:hypothetical protein
MKTLILTDSYDATTDLLIHYIGNSKVFRLNIDQWHETKIHISSESIKISVLNNKISDEEISKVLWRKPLNYELETDNYVSSELKYIFREIFNFFSIQNKTILVTPNIERYVGKIVQMKVAGNYFNVPGWAVSLNNNLENGQCVVKSLATEKTNNNKIIYTTKVFKEDLDPKFPWLLQNLINADLDVTIVFINGKCFSFELQREKNLIDWRKEINKNNQIWKIHLIDKEMEDKINSLMNDLNLKFGRLDFLYNSEGYHFLEVNPNGQWAWLDLNNKNGLMAEMIKQASPNTMIDSLVKTCP